MRGKDGELKVTKAYIEEWLNELGVPEDDKRSNGGLIPDHCQYYGSWLRRNDPTAFHYALSDYIQNR